MIVVCIAGILLNIAAPSLVRSRETSRMRACIANLRMIEAGKEQYALENGIQDGASIQLTWLIGRYIKGDAYDSSTAESRAKEFRCPSSNLFYGPTMGVIGTRAVCPTAAARTGPFPHVTTQ